jgi:predicted ATP-grasp superfamily ATP-dependent carboligase
VLVLDGRQRQSLVAVRSLGRAGLRVGVAEVGSAPPSAASRWCLARECLPKVDGEADAFVQSLQKIVGRRSPTVLIPAHDATVEALRTCRDRLEATVALASETALEVAVDKERTVALADLLGIARPRTAVVRDPSEVDGALAEIGTPVVVKPSCSWAPSGRRLRCVGAARRDDAAAAARGMLGAGVAVLLQEWAPGRREAISFVRAGGAFRVRFAQVAHRMAPPIGGGSVVRESIPLPPDATETAEALVDAMELDGYSEVEFRRDAAGKPLLMEVNPRLSASVEIAVRAGVDFPRALYSWAAGGEVAASRGYRTGVRMRWLGGDVHWLYRTLRTQGAPDSLPALRAIRLFARDFFRRSGYDYLVPSDPRPAVVATRQFLAKAGRAAAAGVAARAG